MGSYLYKGKCVVCQLLGIIILVCPAICPCHCVCEAGIYLKSYATVDTKNRVNRGNH